MTRRLAAWAGANGTVARAGGLALLLLAAPAFGQAPPPSASTSAVEALDATLASGDWKATATAAAELLADPARTADHGAAWGRLGAALDKGGYPYAALTAHLTGMDLDSTRNARFIGEVLNLVEAFDEDIWAGATFARHLDLATGASTDESVRARVALAAARHHFDQGSWGSAMAMLLLVPKNTPQQMEAEVLRGVTLAQQSRYGEALVPLLTSYEDARRTRKEPHYVATLALNVGRTFFAEGNFGRAMEYYDKVGRDDAGFLQAHFERAWAHFRVDDMQGTVALLMTHASPFFQDWFFPEADMLRAQALFLMCKFPEVTKTVEDFQNHYTPLRDQLATALVSLDAEGAWKDVSAYLSGGRSKVPESVIRRFDADDRLHDAIQAVAKADGELTRLAAQQGAWVRPASTALQLRRDGRVSAEGGRVLDKVTDMKAELDAMLTDIELTLVDMNTLEASLYERAAVTGTLDFGDKIGKLREIRRKGKRVWPFEGEYWADELGWYRVDARPDCPESLRRGE